MQSNNDVNNCNKLFKKGQDALKTSFFSFKFKPDYLSAVNYFSDAARGFKKAKIFKESIQAFEEAIKCNKQLLESWAEGQNWQEMADIYIFELKDFNSGFKNLQNSSLSYKYSGKFTSGIKIYLDFAARLIEKNGDYNSACVLLKTAYEDCTDQTHDELIRISLEESFNSYLDVLCCVRKYADAIQLVEQYIKIQKSIKEEKKHKISKNYLKLGMLRIIIDEVYMAENLVDEMYSVYDSNCSDDIDDLKKLTKSFREGNKKDFSYLMTYAFSLFQNNLLKALKMEFDKVCARLAAQVAENINLRENSASVSISQLNYDLDDTKAQSEFQSEIGMPNEEGAQNNNSNQNNADDYL